MNQLYSCTPRPHPPALLHFLRWTVSTSNTTRGDNLGDPLSKDSLPSIPHVEQFANFSPAPSPGFCAMTPSPARLRRSHYPCPRLAGNTTHIDPRQLRYARRLGKLTTSTFRASVVLYLVVNDHPDSIVRIRGETGTSNVTFGELKSERQRAFLRWGSKTRSTSSLDQGKGMVHLPKSRWGLGPEQFQSWSFPMASCRIHRLLQVYRVIRISLDRLLVVH
jgi:hypothetical protein